MSQFETCMISCKSVDTRAATSNKRVKGTKRQKEKNVNVLSKCNFGQCNDCQYEVRVDQFKTKQRV